ncbi:MAG: baseplate J/gp47 family protein [Clostridium sp.]
MAESKEVIHARILSHISSEYDKSEGGFFYDATKPVAIELEGLDLKADDILNKGFVDTAEDEWLDLKVIQQGLYRKLATKSNGEVLIVGTNGAKIKKGDKVASDTVNFIFLEDKIIDNTGHSIVKVQCEESGVIGNVPIGAIKYFPVTLAGLTSVSNTAAFSNGYDKEINESLRQRYYDKVRTPATSGNKWHYLNWSKEVTGVGDAKVFPLWDGNGTVKVVLINSNKRGASAELISEVAAHIENNRPIGATVTVSSAVEKDINISVNLVIDTKNFTLDQVKKTIEDNIASYLKDIAYKETYVSYAKLGSIIFNSSGVIDYSDLQINNGVINISIEDEEVAVLGGVVIG